VNQSKFRAFLGKKIRGAGKGNGSLGPKTSSLEPAKRIGGGECVVIQAFFDGERKKFGLAVGDCRGKGVVQGVTVWRVRRVWGGG